MTLNELKPLWLAWGDAEKISFVMSQITHANTFTYLETALKFVKEHPDMTKRIIESVNKKFNDVNGISG